MNDYLDYMDEIYEELVEEFGHEIESECVHNHTAQGVCRLDNVGAICQIYLINKTKGKLMKLDEYKALIEEQRKASLAQALAPLTQANETLTNTFNLEENN